ncbi:MAG: transglutaminase domain-containing protein [Deltaproteobacteria bacterium]|nr:transglutaminase domain-containing protein [Deltaproteobacteria bacterium]
MKHRVLRAAVSTLTACLAVACGDAEECTSHARTICSDGTVYWIDSCGNNEGEKEQCECGCLRDQSGCEACVECTPHAETICIDSVIYWVDSCGQQEEEKERCQCGCTHDPYACRDCALDAIGFEGRILPGHFLAVAYRGAARSFGLEDSSANILSADAAAALELVPGWLRSDLRNAFVDLEIEDQDRYASAILEAADPRFIDEIAYVVSHAAAQDLRTGSEAILSENAASVYEIAAEIGYAELIEHGEPGEEEHYTTVQHTVLVDGAEESVEIPREIYYRQIVFPIIDVESIRYINPTSGSAATPARGGVFWRDYLYFGEGEGSYIAPYCLKSPHLIDDAYLTAADFGAAAAYGSFVDLEVGPIEVLRAGDTDEPVAIMFVRGDGRCCNNTWPNPDGTYLATLVPVEAAAGNGHPELLENLLAAGNANAARRSDTLVSVDSLYDCQFVQEDRRVLLLRDRIPFDLGEDPNEVFLGELGYAYDVLTSADLPALVLSSTEPAHVNLDYNKIVIPSDQPRAFYEALADHAQAFEDFVDYGGMLEMHLATREADDWFGLRMPGGIRASAQIAETYIPAVRAHGFPALREVLAGVRAAWDGVVEPGLSGDRLFDPQTSAVEHVGWWGGQNAPQNIAETIAWKRRCWGFDRSWYAQRIVYNKYGNCGELADLLAAACRTALIPAKTVGTMNEDHIWDEFYTLDRWQPFQGDWSDAATRIGSWKVAADADTGGGKTVTAVSSQRGDGYQEHVLGRYEIEVDEEDHISNDYSRHVTLGVRVTDALGAPVDGALVLIASEGFYDTENLYIVGWAYADGDGRVRVTMGEGNNYYINVSSQLGEIPAPSTVARIATESEALPGEVFSVELAYDGEDYPFGVIEKPAASPKDYGQPTGAQIVELAVELDVPRELMHGESLYSDGRYFTEPADGQGRVDLYLLDRANYDLMAAGEDFEAAAVHEGIDSLSQTFVLPDDEEWYLVLANQGRLNSDQEVFLRVDATDVTYR